MLDRIARRAADQALDWLWGLIPSGGFNWGGVNRVPGPHRAGGGPVKRGYPYFVGESSLELFVPDQPGRIFNQAQMRGMGSGQKTIIINNNIDSSDGTAVYAALQQAMAETSMETESRMNRNIGRPSITNSQIRRAIY